MHVCVSVGASVCEGDVSVCEGVWECECVSE